MSNQLQTLSQLFQDRLFRIPDYQRGYAWQQPQLMDFWDDLVNLQSGRSHYTGLLSLKALGRKETADWGSDLWMLDNGFRACHIVDGQQRLTTSIILLNELLCFVRELAENDGKTDDQLVLGYDTVRDIAAKYICRRRPPNNQITTYLFGYEADNPSAEYLRYRIFDEPFSGTVVETYYTKNLKFAKRFFRENLSALYANEGLEGLSALYLKLTQRFMFNIHEITDDYDVFVAFETMNNRGKRLSNLELLKNRLIYLTTLYPDAKFDERDKEHLRRQINDAWKEVYYQLGRNERTPLSDDEFLQAHWAIYFTYTRKRGDDYIRFLLNKFSAKNIYEKETVLPAGSEPEGASGSAETETPEAAPAKLEPTEITGYVNSLKEMSKYWYDTFFPAQSRHLTAEEKLWLDRLNRIGIGYFRPLAAVVLSKQTFSPEERVQIFAAVERFIFICFRLGGYNASFCSSAYYRTTHRVYLDELTAGELVQDLNETASGEAEYAVSNFSTKLEKFFSEGGGYYYWNSLKYFLYEYEYSLAKRNNLDKLSWELFTKFEKDKVTVEHILPQSPTKYYWRNQFRQYTASEIEQLSGALGNLLPLSQSINSRLQNDGFPEKKASRNGGRGYQNGSHSEIEISKERNWTARKIYLRSKKLITFLEDRWNLALSRAERRKLIYVTFALDGRPVPPELPPQDS